MRVNSLSCKELAELASSLFFRRAQYCMKPYETV
jgi:hypothetical protein